MSQLIDLVEQRFGQLVVMEQVGKHKWLCRCDCGIEKTILGYNLKRGHTKSCGCLQIEEVTKHGYRKTQTYGSWQAMKNRCMNLNYRYYHNYGGRGIIVCDRWMEFINFLEDMGECPERFQLDRINNNKGYCKENCRWTTSKQNNRNKRNNHLETFNGRTQCVADWSEETGIPAKIIIWRLNHGWSIEKALITPKMKRSR